MYKDVLWIYFPVYSWFLGYHVPWSNLFTQSQLQKNKKQVVYTLGSLQLIIHVSFLNISLFLHRILIYFRMIRALMSLQKFCFSGPTSWCWWLVPHQPITWKLFHVTSDMCGTCKRHEHGRALTSRLKIAWFINSLMWKIISKSHAMRVDKSWQTMLSYFIMNNRRLCCLFAKLIIPYFGPITASSKCALRHLSRLSFFCDGELEKKFHLKYLRVAGRRVGGLGKV